VKVVDLNVLLYAVNADAPEHQAARSWWEAALSGDEQIGLAWAVLLGFVRLSTRHGVLPRPLAVTDALAIVSDWLAQPVVTVLNPGDRHWETLRGLLETVGTAGNLTTDAHLASLAMEYDAGLCSTDRDFARFRSLTLVNPLD